MFWNLLSIFYPPRCPVCDGIPDYGKDICPECELRLTEVFEPVCKKCGKPLEDERAEYCYDCSRTCHVYDAGKAVFVYRAQMKESLYRFKYHNRQEYARYYAMRTAKKYGAWIRQMGVEAIVPIPLHAKRYRERGYNQAELYARRLGRALDLPVETKLLVRVKNTVPQKELNDISRKNNLKKAFKYSGNIVQFKKILLVDDIYTTGSTINAAAEVLKNGGIQKIFFVCISIGRGW